LTAKVSTNFKYFVTVIKYFFEMSVKVVFVPNCIGIFDKNKRNTGPQRKWSNLSNEWKGNESSSGREM